jgi:hypothetical protein
MAKLGPARMFQIKETCAGHDASKLLFNLITSPSQILPLFEASRLVCAVDHQLTTATLVVHLDEDETSEECFDANHYDLYLSAKILG